MKKHIDFLQRARLSIIINNGLGRPANLLPLPMVQQIVGQMPDLLFGLLDLLIMLSIRVLFHFQKQQQRTIPRLM